MSEKWEQTAPGADENVDDVVQRYLQDDPISAGDPGPGSNATPGQGVSNAEGFEIDPRIVERVLATLDLDTKFATLRQDLQGYADRTAQSFSDKTASRLTERQREQMASVEQILGPLREQLGPDYDATVRQAKLDVMLSGGAQGDGAREAQPTLAPAAQRPAVGESTEQFAGVYLSAKLGDPSGWSQEDTAAIHADLAQARDWSAWMAVVDRYAASKPSRTAIPTSARAGARAQPVGAPAGHRPAPTLDRLSLAYNRAVAEGDMDAMEKIGVQIDLALNKS